MIRAIVYDAVRTLIQATPSVADIYAEVGAGFNTKLDVEEIARRFPIAFDQEEQRDARAGWKTNEMREKMRWRSIVIQVLDDTRDPAGCASTLFERFAQPSAWEVAPEAEDVIAKLRERGLAQALASNYDARLRRVVAGHPALQALSPIIISSEIGWRKPAPQFFAKTCELLKLPPDEILFVGDDFTNDFTPARQAGMKAVLFDPLGRHPEVSERIERLSDVLQRLS